MQEGESNLVQTILFLINGRMKFLVILKELWAENAMVFYDSNTVT